MRDRLLSLCVIARDEEDVIDRCLASAVPLVDEIVLADTGSRDRTARLAAARGAVVFEHPWSDDFAAARNATLARASGRFILVLDADEWIESDPASETLRTRLEKSIEEALTIEIADRLDGGGVRRYPLVRLFRNRPEHRYAGAIHEQITPSIARRLGRESLAPPPSGIVAGHDVYLAARRAGRGKSERNLALLRRLAGPPGGDPAARYFLARELLPMVGGRAVPGGHLAEALALLEALAGEVGALPAAWRADAARLQAAALLAAGRASEAAGVLQARGDRGVACDLLRADAEILLAAGEPRAVEGALERLRRCFDRETRDAGPYSEPALAGPLARARAAEALLVLGRHAEARALAAEAASLPGGGAAPHLAAAAVERAEGNLEGALLRCTEGLRIDALDPWAWAGAGEVLLEAGRVEEALDPLRNAATLAPGWDRAEEALGAALILSGRFEEMSERFAPRPGGSGPGAQAALLLASAGRVSSCPLDRLHAEAPASVRRILGRVAAAGRHELLGRLAAGLSALRLEEI
ncbi:MAG TPA: glycosyltransferase [Candidatus Polarisedimenticolia bacterium]|nr:glycosyltransferase [Candidatus Polarisedimenticolia bacterium]